MGIKTVAIQDMDTLMIQDAVGWWTEKFNNPVDRIALLPGGKVAVLTSFGGVSDGSHLYVCDRSGKDPIALPHDVFVWMDFTDGTLFALTGGGWKCRVDLHSKSVERLNWTK